MSRYLRQYEVRINGQPYIESGTGRMLRLTFEVDLDFGGINSFADISIYNAAATTRAKLKRGDTVELLAGYSGDTGLIFSGVIRNIFPGRDQTATRTQILCRGQAPTGPVSVSYGAGVRLRTILRDLARAMGRGLEGLSEDLGSVQYEGGYSMTGDPLRYLQSLATAHTFEYMFEAGQLVVLEQGAARDESSIYEVNMQTGLEGIPVITEVGADVDVRLSSRFRIGGLFQITSELRSFSFSNAYFQDVPETAGTGVYRIQKLQYSGDTHADAWTVKLTGVRRG